MEVFLEDFTHIRNSTLRQKIVFLLCFFKQIRLCSFSASTGRKLQSRANKEQCHLQETRSNCSFCLCVQTCVSYKHPVDIKLWICNIQRTAAWEELGHSFNMFVELLEANVSLTLNLRDPELSQISDYNTSAKLYYFLHYLLFTV